MSSHSPDSDTMWRNLSHFRRESIIILDWMSSTEGHHNIRIPLSLHSTLSPLPQVAKLGEEGKENVIWKWENNYLIITFNAEARITLCTVQYSTGATKIRSGRVRRRGCSPLITWYLPEIITIFFHHLKFFSKPIHCLHPVNLSLKQSFRLT